MIYDIRPNKNTTLVRVPTKSDSIYYWRKIFQNLIEGFDFPLKYYWCFSCYGGNKLDHGSRLLIMSRLAAVYLPELSFWKFGYFKVGSQQLSVPAQPIFNSLYICNQLRLESITWFSVATLRLWKCDFLASRSH